MPDQQKTKKAMLTELESIKGLLLLDEFDIPVLDEVFNKKNEGQTNSQTPVTDNQTHALSSKPAVKEQENPFLPQHIRKKLRGNQSQEFQIQSNNPQDITNLLVASIMPQLERLLRQRLSALSKEQIDTLTRSSAKKNAAHEDKK